MSANSLNWPTARLVINLIKSEYPDLPLVVGGIHGTNYPEHVFKSSRADFIVRGEGEMPLLGLAAALRGEGQVDAVPGVCGRDGDSFVIQSSAAMLPEKALEELPDPAYDLLPSGVYETLSIESARGCKFRCTFCSTKFRGSWRAVTAERFVERIFRISPYLNRTLFGIYSFVDDLYTLDINRVPRVTALLQEKGLDIEGLKRIRKGSTTAVLERAAACVNAVGLAPVTVFSFIIGFPFETREDCLRTIEFASRLMLQYDVRVYLQWFNTIPLIWDELAEQGLLDIDMYDDFGFFNNAHLWKAGVRLSLSEIREISEVVYNINTVLLLTNRRKDVMQFSAPDGCGNSQLAIFPRMATSTNRTQRWHPIDTGVVLMH